jgi:ribonuclease BN (tRNA processing enzyme)
MSKAAFTILGSSAGMPQPARVNSGYVLEVDGRLTLFDCGGGVSAAFRRAGFDSLAAERIFISHTHPDHISDLPLYIQMQYLAGRREPIYIHLPVEVIDPLNGYFRALYLLPEKLPFEIKLLPVSDGEDIDTGGITVRPIANKHLQGYREIIDEYNLPNKMQCYSYLIMVNGKPVLYSADLGSEKDILPHLKNLDLLIIESTHIDIAGLLDAIVENNVGRVVLTHFEEDYDTKKALALAQKAGLGNLLIARDGMRVKL